jgi:uncharacterized protein
MLKRILATFAITAMLTTPAFAFHCPKDMAEIDAAMAANPNLSDEDKAKVTELRQKGQEEHEAGDHQASVETLAEAKALLGLE